MIFLGTSFGALKLKIKRRQLGRYLKLGPEIKILIIMFSSLEMEVIDFKYKVLPLNMHSKVFSSLQVGSIGNDWQPKLWS